MSPDAISEYHRGKVSGVMTASIYCVFYDSKVMFEVLILYKVSGKYPRCYCQCWAE